MTFIAISKFKKPLEFNGNSINKCNPKISIKNVYKQNSFFPKKYTFIIPILKDSKFLIFEIYKKNYFNLIFLSCLV